MNFEDIRKARLLKPFRPFILRLKNGEEHRIADAAELAISQRIVAFPNHKTGGLEHWPPDAVDSLTFVDETQQSHS